MRCSNRRQWSGAEPAESVKDVAVGWSAPVPGVMEARLARATADVS